MSLPTIQQIMEGIESVLDTIDGLHVSDFKPDDIVPDAAIVGVPPWDRMAMRRGVFTLDATVTVLTSADFDRVGQHRLAKYAGLEGASSILEAFENNPTLDGLVASCTVMRFRPVNVEEFAAYRYFGGTFDLPVAISGA